MAVRLERLKVNRYRHLAEPADLRFGDGAVLVVGRNGTGKSNLLALVDAVTRLDFREMEQDRSALALEFTLAWGALRLALTLEVDALNGRTHHEERWRYRGKFEDSEGHQLNFDSASAAAKRAPSPFWPDFRHSLAWFVSEGGGGFEPWLNAMLGGSPSIPVRASRMDEALGLFERVTSASNSSAQITLGDGSDRHPMQSATGPVLVPSTIGRVLAGRDPSARLLEIRSAELPWLDDVADAAGFTDLSVEARLRLEVPDGDTLWRTYAPFAFLATLSDGKRMSHVDFSFGQRRVVAFFWYLQCVRDAGSAVIADELVNGLHHDAVQAVVEGLAGLQAFLAGQDPLLFDFMEYASAADFRMRIVRCDWVGSGWTWRNPTEDEADRFMSAYDIGFQPVNEILLTEGLW